MATGEFGQGFKKFSNREPTTLPTPAEAGPEIFVRYANVSRPAACLAPRPTVRKPWVRTPL